MNGRVPQPSIVPARAWGAVAPRCSIVLAAGRPDKGVFHHTAGHHREITRPADESRGELYAYARAIQYDHMHRSPPYCDSGHNFLIGRNGLVLEGRHGSIAAGRIGRCVVSAHCPGENDNPGVEHEHVDGDRPGLTPAQRSSSVHLYAWLFDRATIRSSALHGHREYYATSCPGELEQLLPELRAEIAEYMSAWRSPAPAWFGAWVRWRLAGRIGARPRNAPPTIPAWAWRRLAAIRGKAA